ncbi:hypothetical protein KIK06_10740 [Nocardiopsis sp. EMB25]|uniref:SCO4225 family membrane protein n=1 Tax=Nocardiopsis TaxID=2013 RepID=UPI0003499CFB|nr:MULTISPECIES: hypothetical protein [Nocardiopsis]MCY9784367.1 hypothetical protein [Nocardiopsis sp. EMB25]
MRARFLIRLTFTNPVSMIYLGLVGVSAAVATAVTVFSEDPGFIWVWPALFTFPAFMVVPVIEDAVWGWDAPTWFFLGGIAVCALVQSFLLGVLLEALRGLHRRLTRPNRS